LALLSLIFLVILVFAGATVRVTGSGLGCPDWPTCWGKLIPPTKMEQVDFEALNVERFQRSAKRFGRDPNEVTRESLREDFNPLHVYIEFFNRLLALPILLSTLILMIWALTRKKVEPMIKKVSVASFALVIVNALFGIVVVASGLKAGVVTTHMLLAFALLFLLTYLIWSGGEKRRFLFGAKRWEVGVLLLCVMVEGLLGSQIREFTDELQMEHGVESRGSWISKIEGSLVYLLHRSFSWAILVAALWVGWKSQWTGFVPRLVLGLVFVLMVMGIVLSQAGIFAVIQVLHVGLAAVLVSGVFYWWLAAKEREEGGTGV